MTVAVASPPPDTPEALPARLGRYVVVEQVGEGGMGRVLRAYDPKLRREVALKQLRAGSRDSQGAARIIREAQAMARLSHPNLVPIYDVEQDGDEIFLAMEFVVGQSLAQWLAAEPRRWLEVLRVFVEAGRGLAAAHAARIVHRDFKPANVMVGGDGRVRVMDFGLARGVGAVAGEVEPGGSEELALGATQADLTDAGSVIGTPSFMAPEQHTGDGVGPASDQYAFCVALFAALFGERPFRGDDLRALIAAKLRGPPAVPAAASVVPKAVQAAVLRGLAVEPSARFESMEALLAVLERAQTGQRRRRILFTVGAVAVVGALSIAAYRHDLARREAACDAAGASIAEVWNDDVRATVRAAVAGVDTSYSAVTADKVMPWLNAHADAWQRARTETCLDGDVRGTWDAQLLDRSLWCLDERRMELEALVGELSEADVTIVNKAVLAAASLSPIDACRDQARLLPLPVPPAQGREEVRAVRRQLAVAGALVRTGDFAGALRNAEEARSRAEAIPWAPLVAAARLQQALAHRSLGAFARAEEDARIAYFEAATVGAWDVARTASLEAMYDVGHQLARHDEGIAWDPHTAVAAAQAAYPKDLHDSSRLSYLAIIHLDKGDSERARDLLERSIAILEAELGPDHPDVANQLLNLGNVGYERGDFATTKALDERALAIYEQVLGPDHPDVATTLNNLGNAMDAMGESAEALRVHRRALEIREAALGPNHPDVAQSLLNLSNAHWATSQPEQARALLERAVAILEPAFGPDHPFLMTAIDNLGTMYVSAGKTLEARALYERALAAREKALGKDHPEVARTLTNLGSLWSDAGDHQRALALTERAVAIYDAHEGVQDNEPMARRALAHVILAADGDRRRAREQLRLARDGFRGFGRGDSSDVAEIDALLAEIETWLRARGGSQ